MSMLRKIQNMADRQAANQSASENPADIVKRRITASIAAQYPKQPPTPDQIAGIQKSLEQDGLWPHLPTPDTKIFCDSIHGNIEVHPLCVSIIDTPEFQRLRDIKQLGVSYYVYPGASHNRFEHCLGVSYLAGQFVRTLKHNQPELGINAKDILCLEIAGLCHDLGHGPFSHVFDNKFVPRCEDIPEDKRTTWKHENASVELFRRVLKNEHVLAMLEKYPLEDKDETFIEELITMPYSRSEEWKYKGREESKAFLYEIVSNKDNGIDVDKWDYLARDSQHLGIPYNFDYTRLMKFVRVIKGGVPCRPRVCFRKKETLNLHNLFTSRYVLHRNAYQHKVVCGVDIMITEALRLAEKTLTFPDGKEMNPVRLSKIIELKNWSAYCRLTDNYVLNKIRDVAQTDDVNLEEAKEIVDRILNRKLFRCVFESDRISSDDWSKVVTKYGTNRNIQEQQFKEEFEGHNLVKVWKTQKGRVYVQVVEFDYGLKGKNPLENIFVYDKENPNKATPASLCEISQILANSTVKEYVVRVYTNIQFRDADTRQKAADIFKETWENIVRLIFAEGTTD